LFYVQPLSRHIFFKRDSVGQTAAQSAPWRKLEMVGQMNKSIKTLLMSGLRYRYPDESPEKLLEGWLIYCQVLIWRLKHMVR
jgi:hypothetical protein